MLFCSDYRKSLSEPLAGTASVAKTYIFLNREKRYWGTQEIQCFANRIEDKTILKNTIIRAAKIKSMKCEGIAYGDVSAIETVNALGSCNILSDPRSRFFICTDGRKDRCCAKYGFPLYRMANESRRKIWKELEIIEASHLGGCRFAPVLLSLPIGNIYGGANTKEDMDQILKSEKEKKISLRFFRGNVFSNNRINSIIGSLLANNIREIAVNKFFQIEKSLESGSNIFKINGKNFYISGYEAQEFLLYNGCKAIDRKRGMMTFERTIPKIDTL